MVKILLFFLLFTLNIFAQYQVSSYQESGNTIRFEVKPDLIPLASLTDDIRTKMRSYYDESRPGELALPTRSIFVAIPPGAKISVNYNVKERSVEDFNPSINPEASLTKDTTIDLNFELRAVMAPTPKSPVEILGYFDLKGVRIVHLKLHQYNYNITSAKLETIKRIELDIISDRPLINYNTGIKHSETAKQLFKGLVVNPDAAPKFASAVPANDTTGNWIDYSATYVKIGVAKDGIYRVYGSDLQAQGVNLAEIQPATLQLLKKGKQEPVFVFNGSDNIFDAADYIEFLGERNMGDPNYRVPNAYGEPYNEYFDRFTDTTVYWITWNRGAGERVTTAPQTLGVASDTLKFYHELVHQEQDRSYLNFDGNLARRDLPYFYENKTLYWQNINAPTAMASRSYTFSVSELASVDSVRFFSRLASGASSSASGSHSLVMQIGTLYPTFDSTSLDRYERTVLDGTAPAGLLANGNNTLKVVSYPTTGNSINTVWVDWIQMEYPRNLKATNDSLVFRFPYTATNDVKFIQLTNISSDSLILWKKGTNPKKIFTQRSGSSVILQDTVGQSDKYFLVKNSGVLKPVIYYKKNWKNLRNPQNKADFLAVSIQAFAQPVKQHLGYLKSAHTLDTMFIEMNDVYDEYSYGYFSTEALREFFRTTQTSWQSPHPDYAMLVGSAAWDFKLAYNKAYGFRLKYNLVPSFGSPISDNLLSVFDSTSSYIPQIIIGRIPSKTIDETSRYFNKLADHYSQKYDRFNKRILLLSGGVDETQASEFKQQNTNLAGMFRSKPYSFVTKQYYRTFNPVTNYGPFPLDEVDHNIKQGGLIISYVGHSGTFHWDNDIRTPSQLLNNSGKGSILTDFGCSTGKFGEPDVDCFAEQFLLYPTGQPTAYISNSSLGFTSTAGVAPSLFYNTIIADSLWKPAEALRMTKVKLLQNYGNGLTNQLFVMTNTYFGDPYMNLYIPPKPNFLFENEAISIFPKNPSDLDDSVKLTIRYLNLGSAIKDTLTLKMTDILNGVTIFDIVLQRPVSEYSDSVVFSIPIKNKLGLHTVKVTLNEDKHIDEIYNSDNEAEASFVVSSSTSRDYLRYASENVVKDYLYFINPQRKPENESLTIQIADNPIMQSSITYVVPFDTFHTKVSLASLTKERRYWFRVKDYATGQFGVIRSVFLSGKSGFGLTDSLSFSASESINTSFAGRSFKLQDRSLSLSVRSAGYFDGNDAQILYNGVNALVSNTVLSHNTAVFDAKTMEFLYAKSFNLTYGNYTTELNDYKNMLDSIDENQILVIAPAHDASIADAGLRSKIKLFGSKYIDSLRQADSWILIGRKNAAPGSVPELWRKKGAGSVSFDSTFVLNVRSGSLTTNKIGPVSNWDKLEIKSTIPDSTSLKFRVIGIDTSGTADTTGYLVGNEGVYDLRYLNDSAYVKIRVLTEFQSSDGRTTPEIQDLFLKYDDLTEVGTNYQSVSFSADTVLPKSSNKLFFNISNGSETIARNFKLRVDSKSGNSAVTKIFEQIVDSIGVFSSRKYSLDIVAPIDYGSAELTITIDPENTLNEFFKDNNSYKIQYFIKGDTSKPYLTFSIDGANVPDGEYINPKADLKIELYDFSSIPLQDTSTISMRLNGNPVFFNSQGVKYTFSNSNPKVTVNYQPEFKDGDYEFSVVARGNSSSFADTARIEKRFSVMNEPKLLNVYNYPNPFANETWFTFKLTQIPDELRIIVYTVAGRKIRDIIVPVSQLKYDFNKIHWDGRDEDGDILANGVYLYRVVMKKAEKTERITEKIAIIK